MTHNHRTHAVNATRTAGAQTRQATGQYRASQRRQTHHTRNGGRLPWGWIMVALAALAALVLGAL